MRVIRIALYACMASVLAGGWAFLYWQSSGLEPDAADGARGALTGLRAIAARWTDQLVGARLLGAGGKAPLEPARHGSAYAALEVQALRLTHPQIGSALAGVKSALEEKTALAKRFAAARAELARLSPDAEGDDLKRAELTAAAQALFDQAWLPPPRPRLPPPGGPPRPRSRGAAPRARGCPPSAASPRLPSACSRCSRPRARTRLSSRGSSPRCAAGSRRSGAARRSKRSSERWRTACK